MKTKTIFAIVAIVAALGAVTTLIPIHQVSAQVGGSSSSSTSGHSTTTSNGVTSSSSGHTTATSTNGGHNTMNTQNGHLSNGAGSGGGRVVTSFNAPTFTAKCVGSAGFKKAYNEQTGATVCSG
jgi:hypothetical protein